MFSVESLLALVNGIGAIVWEADAETFQFSFVSKEAENILGYPVSKWLEPGFWPKHTHPDDVGWCSAKCQDATRQGQDHSFEYRMIAADGRVVWLRDIVTVRRMPDGSTQLFGIALDITTEKHEEAERHRVSRLYEALLENSSDNIGLLDASGTTVYQSRSVQRQLGYAPDELIGRSNFDRLHPDDVARTKDEFVRILQSDEAVGPIRFRVRHKDGHWVILDAIAKRFTAEDGALFVVVNTRDVTEMVEAQQALESAHEQLAHAMKMEAVGRLAGGIAHDFNNLLTVIAGYADLLGTSLDPADARGQDVDEIKRAAHRASLLTRQLLTFSRRQVFRPETLDLNAVVRDVGVLIRRLIGEDVRARSRHRARPLRVITDRSQIEQVMMNLAINARDAMPRGGRCRSGPRARPTELARPCCASPTAAPACPPDVLERIFEPFFTTKEIGKGTGLGLSTVYGIITQSGGDIQVTSELGQGTTFTISLPDRAPDREPSGRRRRSRRAATRPCCSSRTRSPCASSSSSC